MSLLGRVAVIPGLILLGISPLETRRIECLIGEFANDLLSREATELAMLGIEPFLKEEDCTSAMLDFDFIDCRTGLSIDLCNKEENDFETDRDSSDDFTFVTGLDPVVTLRFGEAGVLIFLSLPLPRILDLVRDPLLSKAELGLGFTLFSDEAVIVRMEVCFRPLDRSVDPVVGRVNADSGADSLVVFSATDVLAVC